MAAERRIEVRDRFRTARTGAAFVFLLCLFVLPATPASPVCGDDQIDGIEECDGEDLGGLSCQTVCADGTVTGEDGQPIGVRCTEDCRLDLSGCQFCGNGNIEGTELCDGDAIPEGAACPNGGTLRCQASCHSYDDRDCFRCGNAILEGTEQCEVDNINGHGCPAPTYHGGTPVCAVACEAEDNSDCCRPDYEALTLGGFPVCWRCGNGFTEGAEQCDDGNDIPDDGCTDCVIDWECGNGVLDPFEQCDDGNLANGDCCDSLCRAEAGCTYGGGGLDEDCQIEWSVTNAASGPVVYCRDGDPCDFDPTAGQCEFSIGFEVQDIPFSCNASPISRFALRSLGPADQNEFLDAIADRLELVSGGSGFTVVRNFPEIDVVPPSLMPGLSGSTTLRVDVDDVKLVHFETTGTGVDSDHIWFTCLPPEGL